MKDKKILWIIGIVVLVVLMNGQKKEGLPTGAKCKLVINVPDTMDDSQDSTECMSGWCMDAFDYERGDYGTCQIKSNCYSCGDEWNVFCTYDECMSKGDCKFIPISLGVGGCAPNPNCQDDCPKLDWKECSGNSIKICGFYDGDSCLDWGISTCPSATTCENGKCISQGCSVTNTKYDYKCYNSNIYYFDNCGGLRDKKIDCPNGCNEGSKECKGIPSKCGDGICQSTETTTTCPSDCKTTDDKSEICPDTGEPKEFYQEIKDNKCKTSSWVWMVAGVFGFMMLMMMMSGMKK